VGDRLVTLALLTLSIVTPALATASVTARRPLLGSRPRRGRRGLRPGCGTHRRYLLGTLVPTLAGIAHDRTLAHAFENMRPRFDGWSRRHRGRRRETGGRAWLRDIGKSGARQIARARQRHVGRLRTSHSGCVGPVRCIIAGVRLSRNITRFDAAGVGTIRPDIAIRTLLCAIALIRTVVARLRTIVRSIANIRPGVGALHPLRFVAAEFASRVGPRVAAAKFLAQHRVPIRNAAAVAWIMVPATGRAIRSAASRRRRRKIPRRS